MLLPLAIRFIALFLLPFYITNFRIVQFFSLEVHSFFLRTAHLVWNCTLKNLCYLSMNRLQTKIDAFSSLVIMDYSFKKSFMRINKLQLATA